MELVKKTAPAETGTARAQSPKHQRPYYTAFLETANVLRDVLIGALPLEEIPRFLRWLLRGGSA